ncbi:MAG: hypothetical protein HY921_11365 [Elusimicrobia bacterium]|nr:hypothetical protein [Elusimicrobiota bacterium]
MRKLMMFALLVAAAGVASAQMPSDKDQKPAVAAPAAQPAATPVPMEHVSAKPAKKVAKMPKKGKKKAAVPAAAAKQ